MRYPPSSPSAHVILWRLKVKLDKSIPQVQMLLAKLNRVQLFDLELSIRVQKTIMRQLRNERNKEKLVYLFRNGQ